MISSRFSLCRDIVARRLLGLIHFHTSIFFFSLQQGHRRGVEPCSWVLRNFVGIVSVLLFVVQILVNYDIGIGDDNKAGGTG